MVYKNTIMPVLFAGIGNKFGSLLSGFTVAEKLNKKLFILNVNVNFGMLDLHSLFDFDYPYKEYLSFDEIDEEIDISIPVFTTKTFSFKRKCLSHDSFMSTHNSFDSFMYLSHVGINLSTQDLYNFFQKFKVKVEIKTAVNDFCTENNINKNVLGLHIRASDFPNKNQNINFAKNFVENNQTKKIFLCTDEEEVENLFTEYKNVIIRKKKFYTQKLNENDHWNQKYSNNSIGVNFNSMRSKECNIESFIDMILLSKTNLINTNSGSTFYRWTSIFSTIDVIQ